MIEINETQPVEAPLTIVLRGLDITDFKDMISCARYEPGSEFDIARKLWEEIS